MLYMWLIYFVGKSSASKECQCPSSSTVCEVLLEDTVLKLGIKLLLSSAQTDDVNRSLSTVLRILIKKTLRIGKNESHTPSSPTIHPSTHQHSIALLRYGFNPCTTIDLLPLTLHEHVNMDITKRANYTKNLHESTRATMEQQVQRQATRLGKNKKPMIFEGELVWAHLRKDRFPDEHKSKLMPRGD
jgi:hypothetical protein